MTLGNEKMTVRRGLAIAVVLMLQTLLVGCESNIDNELETDSSIPAPQNLKAIVSSDLKITISWTPVPVSGGNTNYSVFRTKDPNWQEYICLTSHYDNTVYSDGYALVDGIYYYKVAKNATQYVGSPIGKLSEAIEVRFELPEPTPATVKIPTLSSGISITVLSESSVKLHWSKVSGDDVVGYRIRRASGSSSIVGEIVGTVYAPVTEFIDEGLEPRTTFYWWVSIINRDGNEGGVSNWTSTTTASSSPSNVTAIVSANQKYITLSWTPPPEGAGSYYIHAALDQSGPFVAIGTTAGTSYVVSTITPNSGVALLPGTYHFKISSGASGKLTDSVSATIP